jgi:crotonobetainyl-CoA:carnitine CoA-transferase CaiB-like acyl-CoA transferase
VDVALTESVFSMMEGMLPEYGALGTIKQPTGGGIATAAPSNAYPTLDKSWVLIAANSAPLFAKLANLIEKPELVDDPDYEGNQARVRNAARLDELIGAWTRRFAIDDLVNRLDEAGIPNSKVYTAADCANDPQYRHRGMVREVNDPALGSVLQAGVVPHIPESPGMVRWAGPDIGQHTSEVLQDLLGYDARAVEALREEGAL